LQFKIIKVAFFSNSSEKEGEEKEMGFLDHLEELRGHIFRAVLSIFICAIAVFVAKDFVFNTLIFGPLNEDFATYRVFCWISDLACIKPPPIQLETKDFGEQFFVHFQVAFWIGIILSFPLIIHEIWKFVKPGLYDNEINVTRRIVFACSSLFILGVLFGYFILTPLAVNFLGNYSVGDKVVSAPTLSSYVNYLTMFTIPTGIIFQMPIAAYFLAKLGVLSSSFLKNYRRHAIVVIVIIAAIVTPPDVTSQILITIPILLLYEVSINVVKSIEKRNALIEKANEDDLNNNLPTNV
jgi:sec-independent protein translocase protein TatC